MIKRQFTALIWIYKYSIICIIGWSERYWQTNAISQRVYLFFLHSTVYYFDRKRVLRNIEIWESLQKKFVRSLKNESMEMELKPQ